MAKKKSAEKPEEKAYDAAAPSELKTYESVPLLFGKRESFAYIQRGLARLDPSHNVIERRSNVSRAEFLEKYYSKNRPVVLCDFAKNWKALERWTPEYLKEVCGDTMVEISGDRNKNPAYEMEEPKHKRTVKFGDFVDMVTNTEGTNDYYLTARNEFLKRPEAKRLLKDIIVPSKYLDPNEHWMFFWYGPKGTVTPLHHDLMNIFLVQVQGRKHLKLIPPMEMDLVHNHQGVYTLVDCENPDYTRFPKYKDATVMDVEIGPGEALFIPTGWWHHVRALDTSISISMMNFIFPNHFHWVNPPAQQQAPQQQVKQHVQQHAGQHAGQTARPVSGTAVLDESWKGWVKENLDRNCDPKGIVEILLNNKFSLLSIRQAMGNRYPGLPFQQPVPGGINHKMLCETPVQMMSRFPGFKTIKNDKLQLFTIDDFLTEEECDALVKVIGQRLRPSTITKYKEGYRTSQTCDLALIQDSMVEHIDRKIAEAIGIQLSYSEGIQGQKYRIGEEFKAHTDYFEPGTDEYREFAGPRGNRTWTFMIYLNETTKGGGTLFVNLDRTFYPKKGQAVVWNSLYADGAPNIDSMHWGLPVEEGEKVIITKWFREKGSGPMFYELPKGTN